MSHRTTLATFVAVVLASLAHAAEGAKKAAEPHHVKVTFYIKGINSDGGVQALTDSVKKVASVSDVEKLTPSSGLVIVGFDSHVVTYHTVAKAMRDAGATDVSFKIHVPDYAKGDNAAKVDAVFAKQADKVKVQTLARTDGIFEVHFLPLTLDAKNRGFNMGLFYHPIHDEAPAGLGLTIRSINDSTPAKKPGKPKKPAAKKTTSN